MNEKQMYAKMAKLGLSDQYAELAAWYRSQGESPDSAFKKVLLQRGEDTVFRPGPNPLSQTLDVLGQKAADVGSSILRGGAEAVARQQQRANAGMGRLESLRKHPVDELKAAGMNTLTGGLSLLDRVIGPLTGVLDAPVVGAMEGYTQGGIGGAITGAAKAIPENILKPASAQKTVSDVTGATGGKAFIQDMAVPSTFIGPGLVRNFAKMPVKDALKTAGKSAGKAMAAGAVAAPVVASAPDDAPMMPMMMGSVRNLDGTVRKAVAQAVPANIQKFLRGNPTRRELSLQEYQIRKALDEITPKAFNDTATAEDINTYRKLNQDLSELLMAQQQKPELPRKFFGQTYSVLEDEIEKLGTKPMSSLHIGRQLKGRPNIKPDEWKDVGMDEILASKGEWTPEELLQEVRRKRPTISTRDSQNYRKYSTADKGDDTYKATVFTQDNVDYEQPHWDNDAVFHVRTDVVPQGDKTATVINEVQSDLHQAANKKVYPEPERYDRMAPPLGFGEDNLPVYPLSNEWVTWNQLSPEQKAQKVGYGTPEHFRKANALLERVEKSPLSWTNLPNRRRTIGNIKYTLRDKVQQASDRAANGLKTSVPKRVRRMAHTSSELQDIIDMIDRPSNLFSPTFVYQRMFDAAPTTVPAPRVHVGHADNAIGANRPYSAAVDHPLLDTIRNRALRMQQLPPDHAVARKTWPLMSLKQALIDAVNNGSDRLGILDSEGIARVLYDTEQRRPFRDNWHDSELPSILERFLASQGIQDAKFGAKESFGHPQGRTYQGRFMELTPEIKELVKKGLPLYAALLAMNLGEESP